MRRDVHSVFTHQAALPALAEQSPDEERLTDASAWLRPAVRSNPGGPEVVRAAGIQRDHWAMGRPPGHSDTGGQAGEPPLVRVIERCCGQFGGESSHASWRP